MLAVCRRRHSCRRARRTLVMTSLTVVACLAVHALLLACVTDVYTRVDPRPEIHDGLTFHNRNLQNSLSLADAERNRVDLVENHPDSQRHDIIADAVRTTDSINGVYVDDEDIYRAKSRRHHAGTGSGLEADKGNKTKQLPQAIIIGVKKAGTRALLEYLRMHPDVRAPGPETHFFDKNYKKGLDWYRNQMPEVSRGQVTMEKTPSYFVTKGIPGRVYKMAKKTKLIVVLRDPVTRAISDYAQWASRRPDVKPFEEMIFVNNKTRIINTSWAIIKIGVYAQHLVRWLEYFPMKQIHFVSAENLIQDPAGEVAAVQKFLKLKQVITQENFTFNETKGFPCYRKYTHDEKWHCLNNEKGRVHPVIDPAAKRRLQDFYRPFNIKLYSMTGIDFGWT